MTKTTDQTRHEARVNEAIRAQEAVTSFARYMGACPSPLDFHAMRGLCEKRDRAEELLRTED